MLERTTSYLTALFTLLAFVVASQVSASQISDDILPAHPDTIQLVQVAECPSHVTTTASKVPHDGCSTVCLLKVPCGQSVDLLENPLTSLLLISAEPAFKAIVRARSLFRPPIA
ncbi:hypothetical protein [Vibrio sonorensis]|uniref:hypothetical protein n=1 Tax=Vibrio sonorensis TaxID=1004316 RepID=UPI0008DAB1E1|nr:hypothetical protein [Vibrio sonorensis]